MFLTINCVLTFKQCTYAKLNRLKRNSTYAKLNCLKKNCFDI